MSLNRCRCATVVEGLHIETEERYTPPWQPDNPVVQNLLDNFPLCPCLHCSLLVVCYYFLTLSRYVPVGV